MSKSTDAQLISNFQELHKLRRIVSRRNKSRWVFLLIIGGAIWGVWVKTDWTLVTNHTATWTDKATPVLERWDAYFHSLF